MVLGTGVNLFWVLTSLYPPEAREDNQARDVSNFSSHSHRSHFVVKMQVQDQIEETSYTHKGQVEVICN